MVYMIDDDSAAIIYIMTFGIIASIYVCQSQVYERPESSMVSST